ncbi:hypothetical protein D9756_005315 [Leucocoprinus leucothites]|uniref:Autophagy-related protein 27 n=1 Tax=Leucocoprinus leucothites TaxID=201217 RepID=A0A8H5D7R2_9AGAR|nr:hypothetical protein D9756_005315 [Leucoagaricus leucothites]
MVSSSLLAPLICLLSLPSRILADEQKPFDCHVTVASGAEFDLTKLVGLQTLERTRDSPPTTNIDTLRFNLCHDLEPVEGVDDQDQCGKGVRACLTTKNKKSGQSDRIVSVVTLAESTSTYSATASPTDPKFLNIVFDGPKYPHPADSTPISQKFNVTVLCDPDSTSDPKFVSYDGSTLDLEWSAPAGCPKSADTKPPKDDNDNKGGNGDGSKEEENVGSGLGWFFLVILLAFVAYFVLGAYYNYSTYGARGMDLIPHRDFWQEVPYMLKDVISHLCSSVHPRRSSRGGYVAV